LDEEDEWKPVKCVKTGSVKKKKKKTKEQVITKSDVKKLNQCPHCDASYNDLQAFKQHVLGHGVDGGAEHKLHFCLQCGKDTYFKVLQQSLPLGPTLSIFTDFF
jgi:transcription elongation factor Elf1